MGLYGIGRAFNLKYRPNGPLKTYIYDRQMPISFGRPRPPMGGGYSMMQENIFIDNSKRGFWGNFADILYGLTAGFGIFSQVFGMFKGNSNQVDYGAMNQQQAQQVTPQGADSSIDELKNLKELGKVTGYTGVIKNPGDGTYTAFNPTTHDSITGDYSTVQERMLSHGKTDDNEQVKKKNKSEAKQIAEDNERAANEDNDPVDPDNSDDALDNSTAKPQGTRRTRTSNKENVAVTETKNDKKEVDKKQAITKVMNVDLRGMKGSATVTMPDGQTYTAYVNRWTGNRNDALEELRTNIGNQLKGAGWENVTLKLPSTYSNDNSVKNKKGVASQDEEIKDKKTQATDKTNGQKNTEWTAEKKAAHIARIAVHDVRIDRESGFLGYSNGGNAKVKTPDGHVYYAQTGKSLSYDRALNDIIEQLQKMVKNDGWQNVTVV